ncbi:hypothetical protein IP78_02020 [Brevundimonas sp. AAP58]|uniref:hypothetical protein n=1 Tax=Brevundimonas sp. AAP58 TaxID=1523422 RepID=UPI0006B8C1CC|nr:hypothetical protein [Brevundimonas sp. AAP58]KPF83426.1 hypothetical protein IP78_02020 [Brevundimonas sp. AAP58]
MIYIVLNAVPIAVATGCGLTAGLLMRWLLGRMGGASTGTALTPGVIIAIVLAQAWLCAILAGALILAPSEAGAWTMAIGSAVVIWIGFVVPATIVNHTQRGLSAGAMTTDSLSWLAIMVVQAIVLKSIGLVPPPTP